MRSDQCPYIDNGVKAALEAASEMGIPARVVKVADCQQAQDMAPSPYGIYGVVHNGKLLTYHNVSKKDVLQRLSVG